MTDTSSDSLTISNKLNSWLGTNSSTTNSQWGSLGSGMMSLGQTWSNYFAEETKAANQRAYQSWSNSMTDLSNAVNQDAITLNQIQYIDASAQQANDIQEKGMTAAGAVQANAAAAGVRGNSVQVNMAHIEGAAASAEYIRQREFKYALLGFDQSRTTSTLMTAMNKNYSTYSGGDLASSGMSSAMSIAMMVGAFL